MHRIATLFVTLSLLMIVPVGLATHDDSDCEIGEPPGTVIDVGGVLYINDRDPLGDGIWLYAEDNGVAGLQTGGMQAVLGYGDVTTENCGHGPDLLLF